MGWDNSYSGKIYDVSDMNNALRIAFWDQVAKNKGTVDIDNLMIYMKGYKEYTFAIRQSGTDAPTISVIKDDFGLETPLVFSYTRIGVYTSNITALELSEDTKRNINISNQIVNYNSGPNTYSGLIRCTYGSNTLTLNTLYIDGDGTENIVDNVLGTSAGVVISIRETLP